MISLTALPVNILPVGYNAQSHGQSSYSSDDLPKAVVMTLNKGSAVKSMDFNPVQQILLLGLLPPCPTFLYWSALRNLDNCLFISFVFVQSLIHFVIVYQASLVNDYTASINRMIWSPDGTLFGVAYSKNIVHIYSYHGGNHVRNHLEIDAHSGSVNDLAFSYANKQLSIVTCGEDRLIKVWDAVPGNKQHTFEGHEAPVYSVCPHRKENIQVFFVHYIIYKRKH
ncbi:hypothetical protein ACSBR2_032858 [Camellia fascicularis]